ncbi:hypothetical protein [Mycolicibacterium chlorophenolicum]|nr:hypothetical protein [Mycolicibacterium chlorophenolicum]
MRSFPYYTAKPNPTLSVCGELGCSFNGHPEQLLQLNSDSS